MLLHIHGRRAYNGYISTDTILRETQTLTTFFLAYLCRKTRRKGGILELHHEPRLNKNKKLHQLSEFRDFLKLKKKKILFKCL